ncbi:hypothetical protein QBC36DRAFT_200754, partial [Triangularia setosa]
HNDQWQALVALYRTLLHKHHDFFLASQQPSASPALKDWLPNCRYSPGVINSLRNNCSRLTMNA